MVASFNCDDIGFVRCWSVWVAFRRLCRSDCLAAWHPNVVFLRRKSEFRRSISREFRERKRQWRLFRSHKRRHIRRKFLKKISKSHFEFLHDKWTILSIEKCLKIEVEAIFTHLTLIIFGFDKTCSTNKRCS